MKTVLVLSILLCAALAAPAEDKVKAPEAAVEAPKEQVEVAAPEMENNMMKMTNGEEVFVPEDAVPVPRNARVFEEEAAPESRRNCPEGWKGDGSRCFKIFYDAMSWYDAQEHCNGLNAHLASVTSPKENSFLLQMLEEYGQSLAWLGCFNLQGQWMWIDHEYFSYHKLPTLSTSSSHCAYLRTNGWVNTSCKIEYPFICSKNPSSYKDKPAY